MGVIKKKRNLFDKLYWNSFTKPLWCFVPDDIFVKMIYLRLRGVWLDYNNLKGFDQKIMYSKIKNRNPLTTVCADKYLVREYVEKKAGGEILNNLIEVYDSVESIDVNKLPNKFVLKANHGSQMNIICKNREEINWEEAKKNMRQWLRTNYYWISREWQYKNIHPRIVCEDFIETENGQDIMDYRFFCFNGQPHIIALDIDKYGIYRRNLYDMNFNLVNVQLNYPRDPNYKIEKPKRFDEMVTIAKKLSEDFQHVRVDLYYANDKIYFGELTFFHAGGGQKFYPEEFNNQMGDLIKI